MLKNRGDLRKKIPLMTGAGWVALLIAPRPGMFLLTLSSWVTVLILGVMLKQEPRPHTLTMAWGALALGAGNALWLAGQPIFKVVYAWMAFPVLTIAGERLELSRVLRPSPAQISAFPAAVALLTLATGLIWINLDGVPASSGWEQSYSVCGACATTWRRATCATRNRSPAT